MMRKVELGVFMPVGTNGFLLSTRAPPYEPTFASHREIAEIAEAIGLDYLFWMGKWMGFGGESRYWRSTIEPLAVAAAIAPLTKRLKLFATINPLLYHPAVAAKLISTIDDISQGRFGINVVTGNTLEELEQMGVVPDGYAEFRYEYAEEWMQVLRQLWRQERTTFDGRFFHLNNCVSDPKPVRQPHPIIVSAALSDEGLAFAARNSDYQFVGMRSKDVQRVKDFATANGRHVRAITSMFILPGETDAAADEELAKIREGKDFVALENLIASFERDNRHTTADRTAYLRSPTLIGFGSGDPVTGSPETLAAKLADIIVDSGVDGIHMTFVDYARDLKIFGERVMPSLKSRLAARGVAIGP
jgi:pyrimidine oxygenase